MMMIIELRKELQPLMMVIIVIKEVEGVRPAIAAAFYDGVIGDSCTSIPSYVSHMFHICWESNFYLHLFVLFFILFLVHCMQ